MLNSGVGCVNEWARNIVEWFWQGQPEVLRIKPVHATFFHHRFHMDCPAIRSKRLHQPWHGRLQIIVCGGDTYCVRALTERQLGYQVMVIRRAGSKNAYILVQKSREDMGRPLQRWKDNIKIDYTEGEWEVVDWGCVTHSRVWLLVILKMVINIQVS